MIAMVSRMDCVACVSQIVQHPQIPYVIQGIIDKLIIG